MSRQLLDQVIGDSYGKLIAFLAARGGNDITAAEDALADAMVRALEVWSKDEPPSNPEAWLLRTARNRLIDESRRREVHQRYVSRGIDESYMVDDFETDSIPDERLQLMFACAHPSIDISIRTPLILQAVLGIPAERIASAFLVSAPTLSQRLVRAKRKIRDSGIRFCIPEQAELRERLQTVLDSVYAAFCSSSHSTHDGAPRMASEAIRLSQLVVEVMPETPEALGLRALLLYINARGKARLDSSGFFVPLEQQDTTLWDHDQINEAERCLREASRQSSLGRFQIEAAIQSAHVQRRNGGPTPWDDIVKMYDLLLRLSPVVGIMVARAAALLCAGKPEQSLQALEEISAGSIKDYQPYWAVRAHALQELSSPDARECFTRAIGLCDDPSVRNYLKNSAK